MANGSEKYIKGVVLQGGGVLNSVPKNTPPQYASRQHQYFANRTSKFVKERAKYASDFVKADVQGVFFDDFYRYVTTDIRLADVASRSASSTRNTDDVKIILFAEEKIDYFPIGAKVQTMGNTWICTNPSNMSSVNVTAIIQRCNVSYNSYDYYGNIISEPIIVEKMAMMGNDDAMGQNLVLMDGYFNVTCQLNENTKHLGQNQRIILGSKAYHITGFQDFIQEFASDFDGIQNEVLEAGLEADAESGELTAEYPQNYVSTRFHLEGKNEEELTGHTPEYVNKAKFTLSDVATEPDDGDLYAELIDKRRVHLLKFTIRIEEPTVDDDIRRRIANGNLYSFTAQIDGPEAIQAGQTARLTATFVKNGKGIAATEKKPITWQWDSSDDDIASVDENGVVTAHLPGAVQIVAVLEQNPGIRAITDMTIQEAQTEPYISFIGVVPEKLGQYQSVTLSAGYYENGILTDSVVTWTFSGADQNSYKEAVEGNAVEITCLSPDNVPLVVTAEYGGLQVEASIVLEGF